MLEYIFDQLLFLTLAIPTDVLSIKSVLHFLIETSACKHEFGRMIINQIGSKVSYALLKVMYLRLWSYINVIRDLVEIYLNL